MALWFHPLTLQPEQSGRVGLMLSRAAALECNAKGLQT